MATALHEFFVGFINEGFCFANCRLPDYEDIVIKFRTNLEQREFTGENKGSTKIPDLGIEFRDMGEEEDTLRFAMEVSFTEKYPKLAQTAKNFLEGKQNVFIVVLFSFEESPKCRSPLHKLTGEDIERLKLAQRPKFVCPEQGFGPIVCEGLIWAGEITEVFVELWKRDPETRFAIRDGNRINLLPPADLPQLGFRVSDFTNISPDKDIPIPFNWKALWKFLKRDIGSRKILHKIYLKPALRGLPHRKNLPGKREFLGGEELPEERKYLGAKERREAVRRVRDLHARKYF
ncbi:hypothetical protein GP486_000444 [Trichoglossum hirsutum]|uniref:Uncharacterized protein n=1 Tax=Trichoglossum hirsutum TaxID=265104 RepID=A0A9P8RTZ2_9PEZI|nr:hypothetical protein GP486_000444 [Trichoglossum hirsutum]